MKKMISTLLMGLMLVSVSGCGDHDAAHANSAQVQTTQQQVLHLSDTAVTLNGLTLEEGKDGEDVTLSRDIVYYKDGTDETYGEGTAEDMHTAEEAQGHLVVTIRKPGTYRVSGALSAGQLAVDLGEEAKTDPEAVVTLILDGVDITCTVAPAVIFYHVFECDTQWVAYDEGELEEYTSSPETDTSGAGANVILADGTENNISGSYVARIYREGTTKKLHKYDGAFYSRMSMNVSGETEGTGILNIQAENEGLDSELHLTINGGILNIQADNDGINTNEDNVSVTTINAGTIQINAGLGEEGDGVDSNGHLVLNGGNLFTMANERTPDGGIDADGDILVNGGYLIAAGTRNDAVSSASAGEYMELSFASALPAGTLIQLTDEAGAALLSFETLKACQSITFASPDLQQGVVYTLKVNGVVQQHTGASAGGFGIPGGMQPPELPEGWEDRVPPAGESDIPQDRVPPEDWVGFPAPGSDAGQQGEPGDRGERPGAGMMPNGDRGGMTDRQNEAEPSCEFVLTGQARSFSGISDSPQDSGKTQVTFTARIKVDESGEVMVSEICPSVELDHSLIRITVNDVPSEDYNASCLLSEGEDALEEILPDEPGRYRITIAVTGDDRYTGASEFEFTVPEKAEE